MTAVYELRRYRLHPGAFDALADVFVRELVAPQEALGMGVIGPYRDRDAPDDFVWFRRFERIEARAPALEAFYDGPVWQQHKDVANATMVAFDDVRLLRLARGALAPEDELTVVIARRNADDEADGAGQGADAVFVTHPGPNAFPRLPVREDEDVTVLVARDPAGLVVPAGAHVARLARV